MDASLHTLRHTHASILLSRKVPITAVSARLGHADTTITGRVYSQMMSDNDARAADAFDAFASEEVGMIALGTPLKNIDHGKQ